MKYCVAMGSTAIINIQSFIKTGSDIQKINGRGVHSMMFSQAYYFGIYPRRIERTC
jgi:hypothetical protein